jgi:hypothetical protein
MHLVAQFKLMCHQNNTCGHRNQLAWSAQTEILSPTIEMGLRYQKAMVTTRRVCRCKLANVRSPQTRRLIWVRAADKWITCSRERIMINAK